MPSQQEENEVRKVLRRGPTRKQRNEMEVYKLGFPCLLDWHDLCGALYGKNLDDDPKDWLPCQCFCHAERRQREGMHRSEESRGAIWTPYSRKP